MLDRELTGEALNARIAELRKALRHWMPGDASHLHDWERFNHHGVLPYSGGYREQPAVLLDDWYHFDLWAELVRLTNRLTDTKTIKGSIQDIVTGQRNG